MNWSVLDTTRLDEVIDHTGYPIIREGNLFPIFSGQFIFKPVYFLGQNLNGEQQFIVIKTSGRMTDRANKVVIRIEGDTDLNWLLTGEGDPSITNNELVADSGQASEKLTKAEYLQLSQQASNLKRISVDGKSEELASGRRGN